MDPFIESQKWRGFHSAFIPNIAAALTAQVRPRYVVDIEENVYVAREDGDLIRVLAPDLAIVQQTGWREAEAGTATSVAEPALLTLPEMEPTHESYLVIRSRDGDEAVTVIELLSPTNKLSRDGRTEYLHERNHVLHSMRISWSSICCAAVGDYRRSSRSLPATIAH